MKKNKSHALALAIERSMVDLTSACLFLNASPIPGWMSSDISRLDCIQGNKPEYNMLISSGYSAAARLDDEKKYSQGMLLIGKNRKQNQAWIKAVWDRLADGGTLVVAGNKTDGIAAIRKWIAPFCNELESFSKFHAVVFSIKKSKDIQLPSTSIERNVEGFFVSDGMFSSAHPDPGSMLLAEHFSSRIKGRVCDLGAGWGFLSNKLLNASDEVTGLDLFEADIMSLDAAKKNVPQSESIQLSFNWIDVRKEFPKKPYDWVIMNPPFHSGRAAEPEIGKNFIEVAASTLPSGGRLLMVANKNLPYELTIKKLFRTFEPLEVKDGFKVLQCLK